MKQPKVSIIIPVYNAEKYLKKCLDSAVNQTLREIEILCIDDGSTDESWRVIQEFAKKDKRIITIQQKNKGAAVARNRGLELAKGEFVGFVDSDDFVDNNYFANLYNTAKKHKADISVAYIKVEADKNNNLSTGRAIGDVEAYENMYNKDRRELVAENKLHLHSVIPLSIYIRSMLENHNIMFRPELRTGQDYLFVLEASYFANKIVYDDKPPYYYRVLRDRSLMTEYNFTDAGLITRANVLHNVVKFLNSKEDYNSEIYAKKVIDNMAFLQSRLQHAKTIRAICIISGKLVTTWKQTKYKDIIIGLIDNEFKQCLDSTHRMAWFIYKLSHPQSKLLRIAGAIKMLIRAILPHGIVVLRRRYKDRSR